MRANVADRLPHDVSERVENLLHDRQEILSGRAKRRGQIVNCRLNALASAERKQEVIPGGFCHRQRAANRRSRFVHGVLSQAQISNALG